MKAHLRDPDDKYKTICGLDMDPWQTFPAADLPRLIQEGDIGLTIESICKKCRRRDRAPALPILLRDKASAKIPDIC